MPEIQTLVQELEALGISAPEVEALVGTLRVPELAAPAVEVLRAELSTPPAVVPPLQDSLTLPEAETQAVQAGADVLEAPPLDSPALESPEIEVPEIEPFVTPELIVPDVEVPELTLPEVDVPDVTVPQLEPFVEMFRLTRVVTTQKEQEEEERRRQFARASRIPAFAEGGEFIAGKAMIVGEEGPEIVKFKTGGRVFSNRDTQKMVRDSMKSTIMHTSLTERADRMVTPMASGGGFRGGRRLLVGEAGSELVLLGGQGLSAQASSTDINSVSTVNINIKTDQGARVERQSSGPGNLNLDVMLDNHIRRFADRGGLDSTLSKRFGVERRGN